MTKKLGSLFLNHFMRKVSTKLASGKLWHDFNLGKGQPFVLY